MFHFRRSLSLHFTFTLCWRVPGRVQYYSIGPHQIPLLSAKSSHLRLSHTLKLHRLDKEKEPFLNHRPVCVPMIKGGRFPTNNPVTTELTVDIKQVRQWCNKKIPGKASNPSKARIIPLKLFGRIWRICLFFSVIK